MELNFIFSNVKIYKIADKLDVVVGESFTIESVSGEDVEVFSSNDPSLELSSDGWKVTTKSVGKSKIRFMSGDSTLKALEINVVDATGPSASSLGGQFGEVTTK